MAGRPLRALGLVILSWTGFRVIAYQVPEFIPAPTTKANVVASTLPQKRAAKPVRNVSVGPEFRQPIPSLTQLNQPPPRDVPHIRPSTAPANGASNSGPPAYFDLRWSLPLRTQNPRSSLNFDTVAYEPEPIPGNRRFAPDIQAVSASAWILARPGGQTIGPTGQLGGSQAGIRLSLPVSNRFAATGLITSPLGSKGRQVSAGLSWRHHELPAQILVERRFALDHVSRNAFSLTAVTGVYDVPLGKKWRLDSYTQAGMVGMRSRDKFADTAISVARPVTRKAEAGLSVWAAVQPGVHRVDIGPLVEFDVKPVRIALSWRQRVAGSAAPDSGPALSLASDF
jgi:hypothetical protein